MSIELKVYTGTLTYKEIAFPFVFDDFQSVSQKTLDTDDIL